MCFNSLVSGKHPPRHDAKDELSERLDAAAVSWLMIFTICWIYGEFDMKKQWSRREFLKTTAAAVVLGTGEKALAAGTGSLPKRHLGITGEMISWKRTWAFCP